jgi:hypothetical protein
MTAAKPVKPTYRSGWCTTGAAAWSHARCSGTYGHVPYEAACCCRCHDAADVRVAAAFRTAKTTIHDIINQRFRMTLWFTRGQVGPDLVADLHYAYPDLWDVAIEPVAVRR